MASHRLATWLLAAVVAPAVAAADSPIGEWLKGLAEGLPVPLPALLAAVAAALAGGMYYRVVHGEARATCATCALDGFDRVMVRGAT